MAKRKAEVEVYEGDQFFDPTSPPAEFVTALAPREPAAPAPAGDGAPERVVATAGGKVYRVELCCPTPLPHKVLEVEAASEDEAKKRFCSENNISGSSHTWRCELVA